MTRYVRTRHLSIALAVAAALPLTCGWGNQSAHARQPATGKYEVADLQALQNAFDRMLNTVKPSIVSITIYRDLTVRGQRRVAVPVNMGTGFVIRADGFIATNHHVVEDAGRIQIVLFDGREFQGQLVEFDPRLDLAVLKIEAKNLRVAPLADLSEVRVGHWAFTVGNPFGIAGPDGKAACSFGIVSALGRSLPDPVGVVGKDRYYGNLIETDANLNPGSSGGPLFNIQGRVIGICTAIKSASGVSEGFGYAIPMTQRTRDILETLASGKPIRHGYLGIGIDTPRPDAARRLGVAGGKGAMIVSIRDPQSAAARAGLRLDDIITEFNGVSVEGHDHLIQLVGSTPIGTKASVVYYRKRRRQTTSVEVRERAATTAARVRSTIGDPQLRHTTWRGALLVETTEGTETVIKRLPKSHDGIYVAHAPPGMDLHRRGLRTGMVIIRCNDRQTRTLAEFIQAERTREKYTKLDLADGTVIMLPK